MKYSIRIALLLSALCVFAQDSAQMERLNALYAKYSAEPKPVAKVEYHLGKPMINIGGEVYPAIIYSAHDMQKFESADFRKSLENFRDANINLFVLGTEMRKNWFGPNRYDFSSIDEWAAEAFLLAPNARLIVDFDCRLPPRWWMDEHPDELIKYLADKPQGDNGFGDEARTQLKAPSAASVLYRNDVFEYLKAVVEYIESKPWASRVFGYRFDMGVYLEWHYYGMTNQIPDNSAPMQNRFRSFLHEKYRTDEALQKAWNDNAVTLDTAEMATRDERTTTHSGSQYDPLKDARALDSVECINLATVEFMLQGDHVIKEACERRCLVGNFYGYFFNMTFAAVGQHPYLQRVLESPDVDFNSQPPPYSPWNRDLGRAQVARGLTASHRLHNKLYIYEADTRTYHTPFGEQNYCHVHDLPETITALQRDFAQALCTGMGFWYFDFGNGTYPDPELGDYFKLLPPIWKQDCDCGSTAEVAIVGDIAHTRFQTPDCKPFNCAFLTDHNRQALAHAGVAYDTIDLADVGNPNLPDYKVYVFLNVYLNTPEISAMAQRLCERGKTLVWLGPAGYLSLEKGTSDESLKKLTTFDAHALPNSALGAVPYPLKMDRRTSDEIPFRYIEPLFAITDPQAKPLLLTKHSVTGAQKTNTSGGYSYLFTNPAMNPEDFQEIFHKAGVHFYCEDTSAVIYANKSYIMLHVATPGQRVINLPQRSRVIQLLPYRKVLAEDAREFAIPADPTSTYLLELKY